MKTKIIFLFIVSTLIMASCPEKDPDENIINQDLLIADDWSARQVASMINSACEKTDKNLPGKVYQQSYENTFSNQRIESPQGGYCIVSGSEDRSFSSSSSYVSDTRTVSLTITFHDFIVYTDGEGIVNGGPVGYYDYSSSTTYGSGAFSSTDSRTVSGSSISISEDWVNDIVSLYVTDDGGNTLTPTGTLTGTKGTFSF